MGKDEFLTPPKDQIKTIEVENCHDCPFVQNDNEYGFCACNISEPETLDLKGWEELPNDKAHDKCPLKNMNYRIRLK